MIMAKDFKIIQLILAEKKTDKRIKVRIREDDKKLMLGILKKNFNVVNKKEVFKWALEFHSCSEEKEVNAFAISASIKGKIVGSAQLMFQDFT